MAEMCLCADGRILERCYNCTGQGQCNSKWNTGCEGCCGGGVVLEEGGKVRGGGGAIQKANIGKQDYNPSSNNSFGFTKNYDGRIRGGIKTKEYFTNPAPIRSGGYSQFNRIGKSNIPKPSPTNPNPSSLVTGTHGCCTEGIACVPTKYCGDDCNCHWKKTDSGKFIPHPLDVLRQPRIMGQTIYDPVSKTWKEDDLRPRGWWGGKAACWGVCKVRRRWRKNTKCPCNKTTGGGEGCSCAGCLGDASC